ncbi:MAG: GTPase HflX [Lachnospiraceae bacterium]|nr:GTPase HflX [Lachnospiraceae bacterium]
MELFETKQEIETVLLIGVSLGEEQEIESSMDELEELVKTAGAQAVGRVVQSREQIHPATYVGKGKLEEIKELLWETNASGIVCDDELTPAQLRNMEQELDIRIMDRTLVILDIFARRAATSEGKIQVELAQLRYRLTRLAGLGKTMSRLGGGIGTRGPGEKKLEMDRRLIKERISILNKELKQVKVHREVARSKRKRESIPSFAIVGYTNAGKSTLLNYMTDARVLQEDMLFATLDPTTRTYTLPSGQKILLTDTVGFIRKLPHHLIEAFKGTLEEARYADYILHVVDVTNPHMEQQMYTVYETLDRLNAGDKPVITLFNKIDRLEREISLKDFKADKTIRISAKTGTGLEELAQLLEEILRENKMYFERLMPYEQAGLIQMIRKRGELLDEEYQEDGILVRAYVPVEDYAKFC